MKKTIFAVLSGGVFGVLIMISVFSILNMKPSNDDMYAQMNLDKVNQTELDALVKEEKVEDRMNIEDLPVRFKVQKVELVVEETESESEEVVVQPTVPAQKPYYIKVNRQANCVTIYTYDEAGNYTVPVKAMTCSVGLNNNTPLGVSKISDKYTWRLLFGDVYGHYAVRFNGHIMFHSVPYMTPSNDTLKEGQFNLLGQPASLGCVRLCVADAKWIYDNCEKGTIVEVYDSPDPGPLGKPSMPQINPSSPFRAWDPTDSNPANPWLYGTVAIHGATDKTIEVGQSVNLLDGVTATDRDGLSIEVSVNGNVDCSVPGTYAVTYTTKGVLGDKAEKSVVITVVGKSTTETETQVPETQMPETQVPETQVPETQVPETQVPETQVPETQVPETQMPDTQVPETQVSETQVTDSQSVETEIIEN